MTGLAADRDAGDTAPREPVEAEPEVRHLDHAAVVQQVVIDLDILGLTGPDALPQDRG